MPSRARPKGSRAKAVAIVLSPALMLSFGVVAPGPVSAAYTPSCLDGVVAPQLCTLVTAIAGSTFGPRDTGASTAHLSRRAPTQPPRPCSTSAQEFPQEEYAGTAVGTVRGFPATRSTVVTRLGGCRDGVLLIEATANGRGGFMTSTGRLRVLDYMLSANTYRLSPNAGFELELMWSTKIRECTAAGTGCTTVYHEVTPFCEFSNDCKTRGPLTVSGTGVAADMAGRANISRAGRNTTEYFRYAVRASISGRWGRLHLAWRQSEVHNLRVATAPEKTGWRVQPA